jgi:hypothetical protein
LPCIVFSIGAPGAGANRMETEFINNHKIFMVIVSQRLRKIVT